jgi:hypothetical protein
MIAVIFCGDDRNGTCVVQLARTVGGTCCSDGSCALCKCGGADCGCGCSPVTMSLVTRVV